MNESTISDITLCNLYKSMLRIRLVENRIGEDYNKDEMHTPIHLCLGQEAIAVGICSNLLREDQIFGNHRSHGHYLAKGGDLNSFIAELHNKQTGCSRGRGGSMHIIDMEAGVQGTSSIVAGGVPLAVGGAFAMKMQKKRNVAVAFFGDAAVEEGGIYESINFAVVKKLPILFVCENNFYAVCSPLKNRQPNDEIYKRFQGLSIPSYRVDGNNLMEVYDASKDIIEQIRNGSGPAFLECVTYRTKDHHANKTGVEVGYRTQEEWDSWMEKCPVQNYENYLMDNGLLTPEQKEQIIEQINREIDQAFNFAKESPLPDKQDIYKGLFGGEC